MIKVVGYFGRLLGKDSYMVGWERKKKLVYDDILFCCITWLL